ncbi:branched chain amino acid aminotransferase, partial [bacterium]
MGIKEAHYIWMDGELVPWKDAKIHVLSHVVHYGSSVFEGMRAYKTPKGTALFRLKEHVVRLFNSAKIYRMEIPFSVEEIEKA